MRNRPCRRVSSIFILASIFVSSISICSGVLALRSWSVIRATFSRLAAQQGPGHELDLGLGVGLHRETAQQGPQHRLGIEVHARRGLVLIGQRVDVYPARDTQR